MKSKKLQELESEEKKKELYSKYFYDPEFKEFFKRFYDLEGGRISKEYLVHKPEILVRAFLGNVKLRKVAEAKKEKKIIKIGDTRDFKETERRKKNIKFLGGAAASVVLVGAILASSFASLNNGFDRNQSEKSNEMQAESIKERESGSIDGLYSDASEHEKDLKKYVAKVSNNPEVQQRYEMFLKDSRRDPIYEGKRGTCIYYDSINMFSANSYYYMLDVLKNSNSKYYELFKECYSPMTIAGRIQREGSGIINNPEDEGKNYRGPLQMGLDALKDSDNLALQLTGKRILTTENLQYLTSINQLNEHDKKSLNDPEYSALLSRFIDLNFLKEMTSRTDTRNYINKQSVIDIYMMGINNLLKNTKGGSYVSACPKYSTLIAGFTDVANERFNKVLSGEEAHKSSVSKYLQKISTIQESYDNQR